MLRAFQLGHGKRQNEQAAKQTNCDISERASLIQWSYSDSPYYCYGEDHFSNVRQCFNKRPSISTIKMKKDYSR
ncbi:DUF4303 domain-containing protein [Lysinibacillus boronitolerans]|uniref:DUF4303 domain-containing protein n=1 Tax=Lysinibacillus boronitolerans TaxID=309788 RepID=UPI001AE07CF1